MATIKSTIRAVKAMGKGYSDMEIKARQATCNDTWGPSGSLMQELTEYTYNRRDFQIIMEIIDKRLNDSGKNWRHVFKALTVIQYMLENGPEDIIDHCKRNLHSIKTLREFQYIDETGHDQGANVRQKSKEVTALLIDDARLKELRQNRGKTRERLYGSPEPTGGDDELRKAIELSKEQAQIDERNRLARQEENDLQRAIELSEKEAMQRRMEERDQMMSGNIQKDDIIDFFGSLEPAPQPVTGNDLFGGFDPFQQQQQQQMEQQQYLQQQMYLQEQARQQQLYLQEQMRQQQLLAQQQQQQQQQAFANQFASNPHNPFAAPPAQPKPKPPVQQFDISSNPNAVLDPFASLSTKQNPTGPNTQGNPFASSQLVNLDSLSQTSQKNPFSSTNSGKYQWETPKAVQPTLSQISSPPMNTIQNQMTGNSFQSQVTGNSQFGMSTPSFVQNQMTGTSSGFGGQQGMSGMSGGMQGMQGMSSMQPMQGMQPMQMQGMQGQGNQNPFGQPVQQGQQNPFGQPFNQTQNSSFF